MKKSNWASVDVGNQIDNSWNKDTAIALKFGNVGFSVKIRERDKKQLERKHIKKKAHRSDYRINRKIVVMIYCFLLHKLLTESEGIAKKVFLCRDITPAKDFYRYLRFISKYYDEKPIDEIVRIKFKNHKHSKAHKLANNVYKGRKKPDYLIKKKDIEDINYLIKKYIIK